MSKILKNLSGGSKVDFNGYRFVVTGCNGYTDQDSQLIMFEKATDSVYWNQRSEKYYSQSSVCRKCKEVYDNLPNIIKQNIFVSKVPCSEYTSASFTGREIRKCYDYYLFPISTYELPCYSSSDLRHIPQYVLNEVVSEASWTRHVQGINQIDYIRTDGHREVQYGATSYPIYPLASINPNLEISDSRDSNGYYKVITNHIPTISDIDKNIGNKNKPFELTYYVDDQNKDQSLTTTIKLDNEVIKTINNTNKYTTLVLDITQNQFDKLTLGQHTITITCNDNSGGVTTRIFTFDKVNTPPSISGQDENLGVQDYNMQQFFTVTDAEHDDVIVTIKVDNITIDTYKVDQSKKYSAYIPIDIWNRLDNGGHKLYIIAKDSHENTSTRTYTFSKANAIPVISDSDRDLGNKNLGFSLDYTVSDSDNDKLTIIEKFNNNVIRTLKDAASGTKETLSISTEEIKKLAINQQSTIEISVDDGKGGIAKRTYTFTRINTAPIISDQDRDLGIQQYNIQQKYTVNDAEQDTVTVKEFVDNIQLNYFTATLNQERTLYIPKNVWIELPNGKHTLSIIATDSNNATSKRVYTFTKQENKIELMLKKPFSTDAKANKILITPSWYNISNADILVETCNNAFDTNPTWENCTKEVLANDKYTFRNARKEGAKWGINIRFNITRKANTEGQIIFDGFGGSFE